MLISEIITIYCSFLKAIYSVCYCCMLMNIWLNQLIMISLVCYLIRIRDLPNVFDLPFSYFEKLSLSSMEFLLILSSETSLTIILSLIGCFVSSMVLTFFRENNFLRPDASFSEIEKFSGRKSKWTKANYSFKITKI